MKEYGVRYIHACMVMKTSVCKCMYYNVYED